jgi:sterol desaturase/sphingolipid hydroxylase (fatty acid hydroxylase superfamily)
MAVENLLKFDWREFLFIYGSLGALVMIARQFEKKWPADPDQPKSEVLQDFKLVIANSVMNWLAKPVAAMSATALINAAGGGLIVLRADTGVSFAVSLVVLLLAYDLYLYWSHRLSHTIPALWAMHSFHHSAEALTLITGARHLWLEAAVTTACFPIIPMLFKTPPEILLTAVAVSFLPNGFAHLNVRLHLGRFSTWINNPQWHRIHHSVQPEHIDKNFAAIFPIWDVIFATAWIPAKDEFPAAGLVPSARPGIIEGIVWPFRHWPIAAWVRRLGSEKRARALPDPHQPADVRAAEATREMPWRGWFA